MALAKRIGIVLLGYLIMAAVVMVLGLGFMLVTGAPAEGERFEPTAFHYAINVAFTAIAALAGASAVARLARPQPRPTLAGLAALLIVMTLLTLAVGTGSVEVPLAWTLAELVVGLVVVGLVAMRSKPADEEPPSTRLSP